MKFLKRDLVQQLIIILIGIIILIYLLIGIVLPKTMQPIYEKNLYNYLRQPLDFIDQDISNIQTQEIAYIYLYNNKIILSDNFTDLINEEDIDKILEKVDDKYGKFTLNKKIYYYYSNIENNKITKISITDNTYIKQVQLDVIHNFFPIILITILLIAILLISWSLSIVLKIEKLRQKVENFDNDDFDHTISNKYNNATELKTLELALEDMRISQKKEEEYRNQMYQNISHDFKTPLTVIKSHIEAIDDNLISNEEGLKIIEEETNKLEEKVHSLLYLNKLDYIKDLKDKDLKQIDIEEIATKSINKFKYKRPELNFILKADKNIKYYGTYDFWETIIDNLLNNFLRYAKSTIKITIKKDKIIFYNDGEKINKDFIDSMFNPYRKGIKGEFGLGLSIVKKTLNYMGYDINVKNNKIGVSFIIYKS